VGVREKIKVDGAIPASMPSLNLKAVKSLLVHHLDDTVMTPVAIFPFELDGFDDARRFETTDPQDFQSAYHALCEGGLSLDPDFTVDTRWGVHFKGNDNRLLLSVYTDRFGLQGAIDRIAVHFAHPSLVGWLEKRFPHD
jgi:hypothetical protein